jgi:hypothetical protein
MLVAQAPQEGCTLIRWAERLAPCGIRLLRA